MLCEYIISSDGRCLLLLLLYYYFQSTIASPIMPPGDQQELIQSCSSARRKKKMASVLVATAVASVLIIARLILVLPKRVLCKSFKGKSSKRSGANRKAYRTMVVLGSGGHTSEMLSLLRNLNVKKYSPMIFVASNTDKFSENACTHGKTSTDQMKIHTG